MIEKDLGIIKYTRTELTKEHGVTSKIDKKTGPSSSAQQAFHILEKVLAL
jgi:hypothetical protein